MLPFLTKISWTWTVIALYTAGSVEKSVSVNFSHWKLNFAIDPDNSNCFSFPFRFRVTRVLLYLSPAFFSLSLSPLLSHLLKNRFLCQNSKRAVYEGFTGSPSLIDERVDVNCQNWPIIGYIKSLYIGKRFETILTGSTSPSIPRLQQSFPHFGRYHLIGSLLILLPQYHSTGFAVKGAATLRANGATGSLQLGKNLQGAGDRRRFVHFIWQRKTSAMFGLSQRYVWRSFWYLSYLFIYLFLSH